MPSEGCCARTVEVRVMSHPGCGRRPLSMRPRNPPSGGIERNRPMKIAVFGANGPTGRLLTRVALDEEHDVVAFTRHPDGFPIAHPHLEVAAGDVHDAVAVASAIDGTDVVRS